MQPAEHKPIKAKRIILLTVTVLVAAFIFTQSLLPRSVSAGESGWFAEHIVNPLLRFVGIRAQGDHIARKIAHVAEFAALAFLLVFCLRGNILYSAAAGFLAGFLDETLQIFSDRGAMIADVWIDLIGVSIGILVGCLFRNAILHRKKNAIE